MEGLINFVSLLLLIVLLFLSVHFLSPLWKTNTEQKSWKETPKTPPKEEEHDDLAGQYPTEEESANGYPPSPPTKSVLNLEKELPKGDSLTDSDPLRDLIVEYEDAQEEDEKDEDPVNKELFASEISEGELSEVAADERERIQQMDVKREDEMNQLELETSTVDHKLQEKISELATFDVRFNTNDSSRAIVMDFGSSTTKVGFSGYDSPRSIFRSVVAREGSGSFVKVMGSRQECFIGDDALDVRRLIPLKFPVQRGSFKNLDDLQRIIQYSYREKLRSDPEDHPLLLSESTTSDPASKKSLSQILFETFKVPSLFFAPQPVLSLYSIGRSNGLVVDAGDGLTSIVAVYAGMSVSHSSAQIELGGSDLTNFLINTLSHQGHSFNTLIDRDKVQAAKEEHCYVAMDYEQEVERFKASPKSFERTFVGTKSAISIAKERFESAEIFFQPSLIGPSNKSSGIHQIVLESVRQFDRAQREYFLKNIVFSGGSSKLSGFSERLQKEINLLSPESACKIETVSCSHFSAWLGGSVLASQAYFPQISISKDEYDEYGLYSIQHKCIL